MQMKRLELGGMNYDIDFAMHLSLCIHKIEELCFNGGTITKRRFATLFDKTHQLDKPVKYCDVVYLLIAYLKSRM